MVEFALCALSEIVSALKPQQLTILAESGIPRLTSNGSCSYEDDTISSSKSGSSSANYNDGNLHQHIDDFIYKLHKLYFKSVIFYEVELFFKSIESNLQGSIESVCLIFCKPFTLSQRIHERKLAHRLSLFIFYWGAKYPPKASDVHFEEPMRAVIITRPRRKAFRIYYNQAVPDGTSNLRLVNWFDGDNLGLQSVPLLPPSSSVYSNFHGRVFRVPVFHSPPWFWVNYANDSDANVTSIEDYTSDINLETFDNEPSETNVTGGRDHRLLTLLAEHMNFQFVYIEAPGRTQGSLRSDGEANETFTGGIGMLQNGLADFFLGDVGLSWERRKAIEFSFFTLADSGAFATHAPRRLNEALAIIRPFKMDVWPYLIVTILLSGPIFYVIIALPFRWRKCARDHQDVEKFGELKFHVAYIKEITIDCDATRRLLRIQNMHQQLEAKRIENENKMPDNLLDTCIWFTVQLFLKQSCQAYPHGARAKFLMIVYWIAATYVLADVYSAQLTSQFARPAHEQPINTLQRLERAMLEDNYKLFVEKESSSLEMLENGTEIFRHLYALMKRQGPLTEDKYLIDSVEAGIKLIADGNENKAVLGGRETLYFNIKQHGSKTFQLSQKLYTRYSAVAVQIGCPFLDSLNDVLIHLFEGGILDKMTIAEYEAQSRMISMEINDKNKRHKRTSEKPQPAASRTDAVDGINNDSNGKGAESATTENPQDTYAIQPINLRMLQGAFIALLFGYCTAAVTFICELICSKMNCRCWLMSKINYKKFYQRATRKCIKLLRRIFVFIWRLNRT